MKSVITAVAILASVVLSGCVSMPKPLTGEFANIRPSDVADNATLVGRQVRWGGAVLKTYSDDGRSCMEVLGQNLDDKIARPISPDITTGRFVACKQSFLDPAIFASGREVTVTGRIESIEDTAINDFNYRYPLISTDILFLWPEDTGGYYAGSDYEQGDGYYVARYRQPSYYPYGFGPYGYGGFYSPFYYPWYFGGFGHGFYGPGFNRGFYGGFYGYPGYFGGYRGGFGDRGNSPRYNQPGFREAARSGNRSSNIGRASAPRRSGSARSVSRNSASSPAIKRQ